MEFPQISVALIQCSVESTGLEQQQKIAKMIEEAARKGAEVVCLPELFASPYFCQTEDANHFKTAETIPGPLSTFLSAQAKQNQIILVGGSIYEIDKQGQRYNTSLIFNPAGEIISKYRKMHIPHDPNYWEQYYFAPGNLGYPNTKIGKITLGSLICYDQWYPEPARIHALEGTQLLCYPTAIGWTEQMYTEEPWSDQRWEDSMRSHASLNGIFTTGINRVGKEGNITFWGRSFIADPFGQIITRASSDKEEIIMASLDLSQIYFSQEGWRFLQNRRPESYQKLTDKSK